MINEGLHNCEHCPVKKSCDKCASGQASSPLKKEVVHKAVVKLWDESVYKLLEPILIMA